MMERKLFFFFLFISFGCYPQSRLDSLLPIAHTLPEDSTKVQAYLDIAWDLLRRDSKAIFKYADSAEVLSKKLGLRFHLAQSKRSKSFALSGMGKYDEAEVYLGEALNLYTELDNRKMIVDTQVEFGWLKQRQSGAVQLTRGSDSRAAIASCTISDNDGYGVFITDESNLDEFSGNTIVDNEGAPVGIYFNQLGILDGNSDYQGNGKDYIEIRENTIEDDDVTMAMLDVPYRFIESKRYNINSALTVDPGCILEFTNGSGFRLGEQAADCITTTGSLNATGTEESHIIFRGVTEGKGTWLGIGFNSSNPNNKLIYCDLSGGGSDKIYNGSQFSANIALQCESRANIQHTSITDSGGFGIYMDDPDAQLVDFEENVLINNELAPILIHLPQVDQLDAASSYAEGNGRAYIQVFGRAIKDADLTLAKLEVPYRIGQDEAGDPPM